MCKGGHSRFSDVELWRGENRSHRLLPMLHAQGKTLPPEQKSMLICNT
jgi:hypothetical protein